MRCFARLDVDPWPYWSLILAGGYFEWTPCRTEAELQDARAKSELVYTPEGAFERRWYGPGSFLRRPAAWQYRVETVPGRRCWTLFWPGKKVRSWGFWPHCGFLPWREHQAKQEAGEPICPGD